MRHPSLCPLLLPHCSAGSRRTGSMPRSFVRRRCHLRNGGAQSRIYRCMPTEGIEILGRIARYYFSTLRIGKNALPKLRPGGNARYIGTRRIVRRRWWDNSGDLPEGFRCPEVPRRPCLDAIDNKPESGPAITRREHGVHRDENGFRGRVGVSREWR